MKEPNLFNFATKELSQDAFLCWFLSWAQTEYKTINAPLHAFAKKFLSFMTNRDDLELQNVLRQQKHVDILLELKDQNENNFWVVIEDKTNTLEHDQQIKRYLESLTDTPSKNIYVVYFKTGFTSLQETRRLKNSYPNIHIFGYQEIYDFFKNHPPHYILETWFDTFNTRYQKIIKCLNCLNYADVFRVKNDLHMRCALDKITADIKVQTHFTDSYWYIVDQGKTPHICLYEKYSQVMRGYGIHHGIYVMFKKGGYNFSVKQHIGKCRKNEGQDCDDQSFECRVKIKNYSTLPQDLINAKEFIRDRICAATNWDIKRQKEKDNLIVIQKNFKYDKDIIQSILEEASSIESIIKVL